MHMPLPTSQELLHPLLRQRLFAAGQGLLQPGVQQSLGAGEPAAGERAQWGQGLPSGPWPQGEALGTPRAAFSTVGLTPSPLRPPPHTPKPSPALWGRTQRPPPAPTQGPSAAVG